MIDLSAAGLSPTESKCYFELVKQAHIVPSLFSKTIGESRTNTYKVLDSLADKGLAEKYEYKNKLRYRATNPQKLLELARKNRETLLQKEKIMENHVKNLQIEFFQTSEQPGIQFYQGKESIKEVFDDMLAQQQDIYLLRSPYDNNFMGKTFYDDFKKKRAQKGINTYIFSTDIPSANHNAAKDRIDNMFRTWLPASSYDSAVEWNIYGNKVTIISYGKEAFATVIESPQIADSLRQILKAMKPAQ